MRICILVIYVKYILVHKNILQHSPLFLEPYIFDVGRHRCFGCTGNFMNAAQHTFVTSIFRKNQIKNYKKINLRHEYTALDNLSQSPENQESFS